jgi:succinoglycan biosynthesis protein ExoM
MEDLIIPEGTVIRIIVVENDTRNNSEEVIREHSLKSKFRINYFLETRQGIVFARNRSVSEAGECNFCCFTDDDQIVSPNWISELLKCQNEFDADGVAGPTKPSFTKEVPKYIYKFHQPDIYVYGTVVKSAFTGNLLLKKKYLDMLEGPFDLRLNFSGGEDSNLTKKISELGGVIRFNPEAEAFETVSEDRVSIKYIVRRCLRISNTRMVLNTLEDKNFKPYRALPRLFMRFCIGCLILFPCLIFCKADKLKGLIKIARAVGGFTFFFGRGSQFYK